MAETIYIDSDTPVNLTGLRDALTGSYINNAVVSMSLFAEPSNINTGLAVSEVQRISPVNPIESSLAFTSGGTYQVEVGDEVEGATGGATAKVSDVDVTSGTWAGGDAAGTLLLTDQIGDFQAENLDVGTESDVATIAGDSSPGTFTLTYDGETTAAIDGNATLAAIKAALEALSGVAVDDIAVSGEKLDTSPAGDGIVFTFKDTLGNVPQLVIDDGALSSVCTVSTTTQGYLKGSATDESSKFGIPVEGHTAEAAGFVRMVGTENYNGQHTLNSVERDKIIITGTYHVEDFVGAEEVFIGIENSKDISLTYIPDSDGDYRGILPETLKKLPRNHKFYLFVDIHIGGSDLVILVVCNAKYYSGI